MKEDLIKRLLALGLKNVQVEIDLSLPKNSLSAVLNGKKTMPDKWVEPVKGYLKLKEPPPETAIPVKDPTRPWIEEIEAYCRANGFFPDFLIEFHQTHANSATVKAIEGLKKALRPEYSENRKQVSTEGGKSREMYEPEEGTNAFEMRYGVRYKKDIQK